tara:strand:- start:152 stop:604 length:453 start_codon:yes stop_codon:yes gene_type:complete
MNIKILLAAFLLFSITAVAQSSEINQKDESTIATLDKLEVPPMAPKCKEKWDLDKKQKCLVEFMQKHVMKKFNTDLANDIGLSGMVRVDIEFVIGKDGVVKDITATGAPKVLNEHAIQVIQQLPTFRPGLINGKPVEVVYSLPIMFQVVN